MAKNLEYRLHSIVLWRLFRNSSHFRLFTSPPHFPTSYWPYCSSVVLLYQDQRTASSSISYQSFLSWRTRGCGAMPLHRFSTHWDQRGAYWSPMVLTTSFIRIATGRKIGLAQLHGSQWLIFKSKADSFHLGDRLLLVFVPMCISWYCVQALHIVLN